VLRNLTNKWTLATLATIAVAAGRATVQPIPQRLEAMESARGLSEAFQAASRQASPAVVSIRAGRGARRAQGSGVILADGVIVTNYHVVRGSTRVAVTLADGREFGGVLLGTDEEADLAVVRIDADDLTVARLRVTEAIVGEWALAIGNPLGYGHTVTAGIISGTGRSGLNIANYEDFIQTDAAINPGNSGGPLVDIEGRVLGINTAVGTSGGDAFGLGFAIPVHIVSKVLDDILEAGRVRRGYLGVEINDGRSGGAIIAVVQPGGAAARAGLAVGDELVSVGKHTVVGRRGLMNTIADYSPGTEVTLEVLRGGRRRSVTLTLDERPPPETQR
jgi:S1-C subfamily serine protease